MSIIQGENANASDFIGNPAPFLSIESTSGSTHSLTTVANQKVLVIAKGNLQGTGDAVAINLKYNGVTKDTVTVRPSSSSHRDAFCLMYTEVPGAATQNITVEEDSVSGTLENVVIIVIKLLVG